MFFVKIEFGKIVLLDHIADVKVLISILDALEYITLFTFVNILVLLCMLVNTYIKKYLILPLSNHPADLHLLTKEHFSPNRNLFLL